MPHRLISNNGFTIGDFVRSGIGSTVYIYTSIGAAAGTYTQVNIEEGIRATYSICIAIIILLLSWIIRGILEDDEAWITIRLCKVKNFLKFKKKICDKEVIDDTIEDIIL